MMSANGNTYDVRVDWPTVVPLGDTLVVSTDGGFDDKWADAFNVVLEEHARRGGTKSWARIDVGRFSADEDTRLGLFLRRVEAGTQAAELRQTVNELVSSANTVAEVGTHVYDLARELRQAEPATPRESTPPPARDPLDEELGIEA
jgi:hypothetical protein